MILLKLKRIPKWLYLRITRFYYTYRFGAFKKHSIIKGKIFLTNPENIYISEHCQIGPYCRLETFPNYGNQKSYPKLIIKDKVSLQHAVHIYCKESVIIEEGCLIASGCMITDNNHGIDPRGPRYVKQPLNSRPTIIEKEVWLGENVCVLAGSKIGKRSIIGSNSVVKGIIPEYAIAVGNPAKVIKKYNFDMNSWDRVNNA